LTYTGNGTSPSVTVVAITNHEAMRNMMMGGGGGEQMGGGMMGGGMMGADGNMMMNGTQSGMMMTTARSQTGSAVVNSGWQSGTTISVMLDGEGSAHDASDIHVMVFPHLTTQKEQLQQQGSSLPQEPQTQPQQEVQQQNPEVSIVLGSSSLTTDAYEPNPVQISVGDTITWTNDNRVTHTATSGENVTPDGRFNSGIMAPAATFEHTFTEAGEYPYFCLLHPKMVGTVIVS
jgi:plastocyanin